MRFPHSFRWHPSAAAARKKLKHVAFVAEAWRAKFKPGVTAKEHMLASCSADVSGIELQQSVWEGVACCARC